MLIQAGIPFGLGSARVITYANNYLAQACGIYAASVLAGNNILRSVTGAELTLTRLRMYTRSGLHWGSTVLGVVEVVCVGIPVVFWLGDDRLRGAICQAQQT